MAERPIPASEAYPNNSDRAKARIKESLFTIEELQKEGYYI